MAELYEMIKGEAKKNNEFKDDITKDTMELINWSLHLKKSYMKN